MIVAIRRFLLDLRQKEPAPPWTAWAGLGLLAGYLALRIAALTVVSVLVEPDLAAQGVLDVRAASLAGILAAILAAVMVWGMVGRRIGAGQGGVAQALRLDRRPRSILLLTLTSLGAAILIDFLPLFLQTVSIPVALQGMEGAAAPIWLLAGAYVVLFGPLAETLILQGVLYPALAAGHDNRWAVAITALLFALMRAFDNPLDLLLWGESFLTGAYLTGVRAHQKSTRAALLAAIVFGAFALYKTMRLFR